LPAVSVERFGGTTKTIELELTDFSPQATPLIVSVTPLSSIGSVNLRSNDPTAVRGVTAGTRAVWKMISASIPGASPSTAAGVVGVGVAVGLTVGDGEGVGVAVGVAVGEGVGVGELTTANRLAPVAKFKGVVVVEVTVGLSK